NEPGDTAPSLAAFDPVAPACELAYVGAPMSDPSPEDLARMINQNPDGWSAAMGLRFERATRDEVIAELDAAARHLQAYGVVHGGVHSGIIETLASVGAAIDAMTRSQSVVGVENHTSFVRAVRAGRLKARAVPITRGRRSQLWEGTVTDEQGKV